MARLKYLLVIFNLLFSGNSIVIAQEHISENFANMFFSEFINNYYSDSLVSFSGSKYGYDLKSYTRIYLVKIDSNELSKRCRFDHDFTIDSNIYERINNDDKSKYKIVDKFVDDNVNIYIDNVCCLNLFGYIFNVNIYFNSSSFDKSNFITPFYYSFRTGKITKIEYFQYLSN